MCGIAGIIGPKASNQAIGRMVAAMRHRGPDGEGTWLGTDVALGHTRLAILDPGPDGNQPFRAATGGAVCTFNGEIYNYPELRPLLVEPRSRCDTELFVGTAMTPLGLLPELRGMFAVAMHDEASHETSLARDPMAIKPLYIARSGADLVFASELRTLLASGLIEPSLAPTVVVDMLRFGGMVHPRTAIASVRRLDPGSLLTVRQGGEDTDTLVPIATGASEPPSSLDTLVRESVSAHLLADVEVGLFLSGGVDSSILARCLRDAGADGRALTVRVPGSNDEVPAAMETARAYGLSHEVVDMSEDECLETVNDYFGAMDSPAADGLNTFLVSRAAARIGLKVCLSGVGGDELFGGYAITRRLAQVARLRVLPPELRRGIAAIVREAKHTRPMRRLATAINLADDPEGLAGLAHRIFSEDEVVALCSGTIEPAWSTLHPDDRIGYLRDILLADADVFGMANSVEIRVPFVDRRLATGLDLVRQGGGEHGRAALVQAFGDDLLQARLTAPKRGFSLPLDAWMRGPLAPLANRLRHEPPTCLVGLIDEGGVARTYHGWHSRLGPHAMEVWTLLALYQWGDRHDARLAGLPK